jgi:hypothetical protein
MHKRTRSLKIENRSERSKKGNNREYNSLRSVSRKSSQHVDKVLDTVVAAHDTAWGARRGRARRSRVILPRRIAQLVGIEATIVMIQQRSAKWGMKRLIIGRRTALSNGIGIPDDTHERGELPLRTQQPLLDLVTFEATRVDFDNVVAAVIVDTAERIEARKFVRKVLCQKAAGRVAAASPAATIASDRFKAECECCSDGEE